jgi:hypothetical protein
METGETEQVRKRRRPRPALRGTIGAVSGAAAVAAPYCFEAIQPHGPAISSASLAVVAAISALAGFGGGATLYVTGKSELYETIRAEKETQNSLRLRTRRLEVLTVQELLADALNELIGSSEAKQIQYLGRFVQAAAEGTARATAAMQDSEDVEVRAVFIEYSEVDETFVRGPMAGQRPPIDFLSTQADDFYKAAKKLMDIRLEPYVIGDNETTDSDITRLRLPGGSSHYVRVRVASGERKFGLLCIDTWGTNFMSKSEIEPVLAIAKILAAGLTVQGSGVRKRGDSQ